MANLRVDKITSTETFETTGSVQFDGSGDRLVTTLSSSPSNSSFTIESWVYFSGSTSSGNYTILDFANATGGYGIFVKIDNGTANFRYYSDNSGTAIGSGVSVSFTSYLNTWVHIATTFDGSTYRAFFDGDLIGSFSTSTEVVALNRLTIGARSDSAVTQPWQGHISNLRHIAGKALYTENFTPPTRELTVTPETILLACQHKTDASHEKTGKTITVNGNAVANELTPGLLTDVVKSGGNSAITGSVEFDGNGDFLGLPDSSDFTLDGDFTIEFFLFHNNSASTYYVVADARSASGNVATKPIILFNNNPTRFVWFTNTEKLFATVSAGSWHHIAFARSGSTIKMFLNGVETGSYTDSNTFSRFIEIGNSYDDYEFVGFLSNFRMVKGTALYTSNFIPPTRELKKVPGTVLLCCQDSNDPTTEATGKTITPYGSLGNGSLGSELVTSNDIWTMECGGSGCSNWTASNNGSSLAGTTVTSGYIRATYTVPEGDYLVSFRWTGGNLAVQSSAGYLVATDGTDTDFGSSEDGAYSVYMTDTTFVRFTATSWNTAYTVDDISIKRIYKNNGASNFTPQVGNDGSVEFVGSTKINTENYFYLPTGNTESRTLNVATQASSSARGLFGGAYEYGNPAGTRPTSDVIDYVTIPSTGNAIDFGDLTESRGPGGACASPTRGVWMGGDKTASPHRSNTIDYVTISSKGNAQDFGDTILPHGHSGGILSDSTRGISGGGNIPVAPSIVNGIEYITIASTGNGRDFGDLTVAKYGLGAVASPTRGVFSAGDLGPAFTNTMDYITIQSMGNAIDFGDGITNTSGVGAASNSIRGLFAQGIQSPYQRIDYITIASTGNAIEFGNLTTSHYARFKAGAASPTRAVFAGGYASPNGPGRTDMDYVTIMSTGNAADFGDLTTARGMSGGCSNGHGGLG